MISIKNIFLMYHSDKMLQISFKEKYRYGNFYALSAGWYLSKESFMDESIFDTSLTLESVMAN